MNVCLFVCIYVWNLYKFTFLNRSEPNFAHVSPLVWKRPRLCMDPKLPDIQLPLRPFGSFLYGGHCRIMGTRLLPALPFSAIPLYPWFQMVFAWRHWHDVADGGVIRGRLISVILARVPLTSRKWSRSRRQSHPPQRSIPYSGGCSRHVTDITFYQATGPSATALYPSFQLLFLWPTGNHVLAKKQQLCVPTASVLHCR
jgi:hypothetical protein